MWIQWVVAWAEVRSCVWTGMRCERHTYLAGGEERGKLGSHDFCWPLLIFRVLIFINSVYILLYNPTLCFCTHITVKAAHHVTINHWNPSWIQRLCRSLSHYTILQNLTLPSLPLSGRKVTIRMYCCWSSTVWWRLEQRTASVSWSCTKASSISFLTTAGHIPYEECSGSVMIVVPLFITAFSYMGPDLATGAVGLIYKVTFCRTCTCD